MNQNTNEGRSASRLSRKPVTVLIPSMSPLAIAAWRYTDEEHMFSTTMNWTNSVARTPLFRLGAMEKAIKAPVYL
jgi:hypothetical protein